MNIKNLIKHPEGRRLEFKSELPENADLAKTIVAFANDAGGELYIGISDNPRESVGIAENELLTIEEKISNIIYDRCYPAILPEITFLMDGDKHLIKVSIYRGSTPPYYLKDKGKLQGTYIRVGSSNRQADETIIAELERRKRNISFDSELIMDKSAKDLDIKNFKEEYKEKTGEILDSQTLRKLELTRDVQGVEYPTNALVLFSDDELRQSMFHFAKVECARFKGTNSEEFIDQKSIYSNISTQAEEAYNFVLRHINKGATVEGVYTISRWEYPVKAVREVIRNAIVHRDYSLTGKDVKVAVYDDLIEITSQGLLPPSIDYSAMESRQSDARNKIIAPVFKHFGVIDQWGNGLKLIADELRDYPQIDFRWKEVGLSFQVQFVKLDFVAEQEQQESGAELGAEFGQELPQNAVLTQQESRAELRAEFGAEFGQELPQNAVLTQQESGAELRAEFGQELKKTTLYSSILMQLFINEMNKQELANALSLETVSGYMNRTISKLLEQKLIDRTIPNNPNHPAQKFRLTERGKIFLELLAHKK